MVTLLAVGLDFYFAAALGISGLAKLKQLDQFAAMLQAQQLLPASSIGIISHLFPFAELALGGLLIAGAVPSVTAVLVLFLFLVFLVVQSALFLMKRGTDCGCYGTAYLQKADEASLLTSVIFVGLASLRWWAVTRIEPFGGTQRSLLGLPMLLLGLLLAIRTLQPRWRARRLRDDGVPSGGVASPPYVKGASRLQLGDILPLDLGIPLSTRTFLLFVSYGCQPCSSLCKMLMGTNLGEWSLVTILKGQPSYEPAALAQADDLVSPLYAQSLHDPNRKYFDNLGIIATPTVLAFADGRLTGQQIGPNIAWFTEMSSGEQRHSLFREHTVPLPTSSA